MTDHPTSNRRSRWLVTGLALLFLGPLAIAWTMYLTGRLEVSATTNEGTLVSPPRPLPTGAHELASGEHTADDFPAGAWTLFVVADADCDDPCRQQLYLTRQTRTALGKDQDRVRRVLVVGGTAPDADWLAAEHPQLLVVPASGNSGAALATALGQGGPAAPGTVYLADPLGNLMMRYEPGGHDRRILEDLKRLLKLSRIG